MAVNERFDFSDCCVLITGGGKGIGKVYVEEFAKGAPGSLRPISMWRRPKASARR
jgi:NAD(P)-dependent dehydrogenase (short-subunit alcohol dehydrogenase family)